MHRLSSATPYLVCSYSEWAVYLEGQSHSHSLSSAQPGPHEVHPSANPSHPSVSTVSTLWALEGVGRAGQPSVPGLSHLVLFTGYCCSSRDFPLLSDSPFYRHHPLTHLDCFYIQLWIRNPRTSVCSVFWLCWRPHQVYTTVTCPTEL